MYVDLVDPGVDVDRSLQGIGGLGMKGMYCVKLQKLRVLLNPRSHRYGT
jgi:hypothetical protein